MYSCRHSIILFCTKRLYLSHSYHRVYLLIITIWISNNSLRKNFLIFTGAFALLATLSVYGYIAREKRLRVKEIGNWEILRNYIPFRDKSKVAKLDSESTLKFTDNLPSLDGATELLPVYSAFYQATYPQVDTNVHSSNSIIQCNNTRKAYPRLLKGKVDLIFVAAPSKEQLNAFKENGIELVLQPIGKEAFVFFVNKSNKINSLPLEQIKRIYSGKIKNWKEVGGISKEIKAYQRADGSGSQSALERLMEDTTIEKPDTEKKVGGMMEIINTVAAYRNTSSSLGFTFRFYSLGMIKEQNIKYLAINGIESNFENVSNDTYPITNEFYAVTTKDKLESNPNIQKLIDWILAIEGQFLIEKTGYASLKK